MNRNRFSKALSDQRANHIITDIILIALGILIIAFNGVAAEVFSTVMGVILLILGCAVFGTFFWLFFIFDPWILLKGIVLVGLGVLALVSPSTFMTWIFYIVALYFIYQGILEMVYSVNLNMEKTKTWWVDFVYGLLLFLAAITLLVLEWVFPGVGASALMITAGSLLCLEGVLGLIFLFATKRTYKKWGKTTPRGKDDEHDVVSEQ